MYVDRQNLFALGRGKICYNADFYTRIWRVVDHSFRYLWGSLCKVTSQLQSLFTFAISWLISSSAVCCSILTSKCCLSTWSLFLLREITISHHRIHRSRCSRLLFMKSWQCSQRNCWSFHSMQWSLTHWYSALQDAGQTWCLLLSSSDYSCICWEWTTKLNCVHVIDSCMGNSETLPKDLSCHSPNFLTR